MLPTSITICGEEFTIKQVKEVGAELKKEIGNFLPSGYMDFDNRVIEIKSTLPLPEKHVIFLHECLEVVFEIAKKDGILLFSRRQKERAVIKISEFIYRYWVLTQKNESEFTEEGIMIAVKEAEEFLNKNSEEKYALGEKLAKRISQTVISVFRLLPRNPPIKFCPGF